MTKKHTAKGPLSATKFFLTLSIAPSGITVLPPFSWGVTSTGSHFIGAYLLSLVAAAQAIELRTLAAAKISFTD